MYGRQVEMEGEETGSLAVKGSVPLQGFSWWVWPEPDVRAVAESPAIVTIL